jgi:hypothetical protein
MTVGVHDDILGRVTRDRDGGDGGRRNVGQWIHRRRLPANGIDGRLG